MVGPDEAGELVGDSVGSDAVGDTLGDALGSDVVGAEVCATVGTDEVGGILGEVVGSEVVGTPVGTKIGCSEAGDVLGYVVGCDKVGNAVGTALGMLRIGVADGGSVGSMLLVGDAVDTSVGFKLDSELVGLLVRDELVGGAVSPTARVLLVGDGAANGGVVGMLLVGVIVASAVAWAAGLLVRAIKLLPPPQLQQAVSPLIPSSLACSPNSPQSGSQPAPCWPANVQ